MSLFNSFDRSQHFGELNTPLETQGEGVLAPALRKAACLANLTVGAGTAGTAGTGVTAVETFDGSLYTTVLTFTAFEVMTLTGDNAALADGALAYTFPAGDILVEGGLLTGTVDADMSVTTDTPEVGCGTVVASGANATLGAVGATSENILGPFVAASVNDGAVSGYNAASGPFVIASAGAHTVYLNAADTWADVTAAAPLTFTGTIVLKWRKV